MPSQSFRKKKTLRETDSTKRPHHPEASRRMPLFEPLEFCAMRVAALNSCSHHRHHTYPRSRHRIPANRRYTQPRGMESYARLLPGSLPAGAMAVGDWQMDSPPDAVDRRNGNRCNNGGHRCASGQGANGKGRKGQRGVSDGQRVSHTKSDRREIRTSRELREWLLEPGNALADPSR